MKFLDEKGRLFGKLNIFDLLILLLVIVGVVGMATRLLIPGVQQAELKTATYQIEFVEVSECYTTAFQVGDPIYEGGVLLGTVTEVKVRPAETAKVLADGSVKMVEHVLRYDIDLTLTTDRFLADGGYHVDAQEMLAGTSHLFGNGFATATGTVRTVTIAE